MTSRRRQGLKDRWLPYVAALDECELSKTLLVIAAWMTDTGCVSYPRQQVAKILDITPGALSHRIARACALGFLSKRGGGYRGRAAEYEALIPTGQPTPQVPYLTAGKLPTQEGTITADQDPSHGNLSPAICPSCGQERFPSGRAPIARVTKATRKAPPPKSRRQPSVTLSSVRHSKSEHERSRSASERARKTSAASKSRGSIPAQPLRDATTSSGPPGRARRSRRLYLINTERINP